MSYLDYSRPDDRGERKRLEELIAESQVTIETHMENAKVWRGRSGDHAILAVRSCVEAARKENRKLKRMQQQLAYLDR